MTGVDATTMPARIAALPRDRRGYPVPYVASWSSDTSPDAHKWVWETVRLPGLEWSGSVVPRCNVCGQGSVLPRIGTPCSPLTSSVRVATRGR